MKLKQLIDELRQIEKQRGGDIEVYRGDSEWETLKIESVGITGVPGKGLVVYLDCDPWHDL